VANSRRKFNAILRIKVDDSIFDEDSVVNGAIVDYYESFYHEEHPLRPLLNGISYNSINIDDLGKEKALGPDGFNIAFF